MKKTLLLVCFTLISALSFGQTNLVVNGSCDIHGTGSDTSNTSDNADAWDMTPNSTLNGGIVSPYRYDADDNPNGWRNDALETYLSDTYKSGGSVNEQPGSTSDGNYNTTEKTRGVKLYEETRRLYQRVIVEAGAEYTFTIESRSNTANTPSEIFMLNEQISTEVGLENGAADSRVDYYHEITNDFNASGGSAGNSTFTTTTFDFTATSTDVVIYVRSLQSTADDQVYFDNISLVKKAATSSGTVVTPSTTTFDAGYMNAFNLDNSFAFGFGYPVADMKTTQTATSVTLQPNFAIWTGEDGNAAWFDTNPKTPNKYVEANSYTESSTAYNGEDLTFEGVVNVDNLDNAYTVTAFIKALDPNNSFATVVNKTVELTAAGQEFSVSATAAELATGLIVQYGFSVVGPPADPANESAIGSIVVGEPGTASIDDVFASKVTVYPNPANSFINISSAEAISGVEVYNVIGKRVLQVTNVVNNSIDVSSLSKGMYILKIASGDSIATKKIIKN